MIQPGLTRSTRLAAWVFAALGLAFGGFLLVPDDGTSSRIGFWVLACLGITGFGSLAGYCHRMACLIPSSDITVDEDGLWPAGAPKSSGLVPWTAIAGLRDRFHTQRLDILDARGAIQLRLEYQLVGFEDLRRLIVERGLRRRPVTIPATFTKSAWYHSRYLAVLFGFGGIAGVTLVLSFFGPRGAFLVFAGGFGLMVALEARDYLTTVCRLVVRHDGVDLGWPLASRRLDYRTIEAVELGDTYFKGYRRPEVRLIPAGSSKAVSIERLGIDAASLYDLVFRQWVAARSVSATSVPTPAERPRSSTGSSPRRSPAR